MGQLFIFLVFSMANGQKSLSSDGICGVSNDLSSRVVGGGNISAELAPWNVILERKVKAKPDRIITHCGGNIITPNFVVTAAHCFWGDRFKIINPGEINVYAGRSSIRPKNEAMGVKRFILHEKWYKTEPEGENVKLGHDIALLQLERQLIFSDTIQPICLPQPTVRISAGTSVTINGYGLIKKTPSKIRAQHLQTGDMEIMDKVACTSSWSGRVEGDQLCAQGAGVDSCNGDSGSGLTVSVHQPGESPIAVLVGLTSFGQYFCTGGKPGVYTNILSHVDWIEKKIRDIFNQKICVTISGPAVGSPCVFPFIYKNKTYTTCTLDGTPENDREPWCSTKVDGWGNHVAKKKFWGRCSADCSEHSGKVDKNNKTSVIVYLSKYGYFRGEDKNNYQMDDNTYHLGIMKFQAFNDIKPYVGDSIEFFVDQVTEDQMNKPRCGSPDIIDELGISPIRRNMVILQGSKWRRGNITYRITKYPSPSSTRMSNVEVDREMRKAFDVWSKHANLNFIYKRRGRVHMNISFESGAHGDDDDFDGSGGVLAHSFFPVDGGDTHFDDEEEWVRNNGSSSDPNKIPIDLLATAAHQIGHALGLSHSKSHRSLMVPYYRGYTKDLKLLEDDIQAIQKLYGKNPRSDVYGDSYVYGDYY